VELDGSGLGEHVDHRMPVRAERQPGTGLTQRHARPDAVCEVGLGGRAEAGEDPGVAKSADVVVGEVGGVDCRGAGRPDPGHVEQRDG
jgi:hypothetical protein